jgi:glycosyltransferase involved in cell wall biosynthesis
VAGASWLEARGVPHLLDAGARRPAVRFRLLWRPWGDSLGRVRQWLRERPLGNVEVVVGRRADMAREYQGAHVTVAPFTDGLRSKPAPNSLIESLACGRLVLASDAVGLAEVIREGGAGEVCAATGECLAEHLDRLAAGWGAYSRRARELAQRWFAEDRFVGNYRRLYEELFPTRVRPGFQLGGRPGARGH